MSVPPEQEWLLVGCGLIAHADEILDIGEWDAALRLIDETLSEPDRDAWKSIFADIDLLEEHFERLPPVDDVLKQPILHRCWKMALVDGQASDIEETIHDRIARRLGINEADVSAWRISWTQEAYEFAEMVAGLAAAFANLDGHLAFSEAIHFDNLLERLPLPIGRRVELSELLNRPPALEPLIGKLAALAREDRHAALGAILPLVLASQRGGRERDAFFELAGRLRIGLTDAERMLARDVE